MPVPNARPTKSAKAGAGGPVAGPALGQGSVREAQRSCKAPAATLLLREKTHSQRPLLDSVLQRLREARAVEPRTSWAVYRAAGNSEPIERIGVLRKGVPAQLLVGLANDMRISRDRLYDVTGIARTTANKKLRTGADLSQDDSARALGMAQLIGRVDQIVRESGDPQGFDAARWTAEWLQQPNAALGVAPEQLMDTADGRTMVMQLIEQMQSGAYA